MTQYAESISVHNPYKRINVLFGKCEKDPGVLIITRRPPGSRQDMTQSSQSQEVSGGGNKLRLVIPKVILRQEDIQPTVKDTPNALVTGFSSIKLNVTSPQPNSMLECIPLSVIILKATQRSFRQLENIDELASRMTDAERKLALLEYILECRLLFAKLLALVEWRERFPAVCAVEEYISQMMNGKVMKLTETADRMCVKHYELARQDCPLFDGDAALKRLRFGYVENGLPTIFSDYIDEDRQLSEVDKEYYLKQLYRLIATRLSSLTLPQDCVYLGIEKGVVKFSLLKRQVVLELSLVPSETLEPKWFLINANPCCSRAQDSIKGSLGSMLQAKYNQRPFERDTILSIYSDLQLYMSLFFLHQLYCQLTAHKSTVNMKIDHGEGYLKVLFYPQADCEKLVLTVNMKGSVIIITCSWNQDFRLEPSFECFDVGNLVVDDVFGHLCRQQFSKIELHSHLQSLPQDNQRLFRFHGMTARVSVLKKTGQFEVQIDGTKQVLSSPNEVERLCKFEASKSFISSLEHGNVCKSFTNMERTKIGSYPTKFIRLDDSFCLCVGMDDLELKRFLVFATMDSRYPSLLNIVKWQSIPNCDDFWFVEPKLLKMFKIGCHLQQAGVDYKLADDKMVCLNMPLHMGVERITFTSECEAQIQVDPSMFRTDEISIKQTSFEKCLSTVQLFLALLLIVSQQENCDIVGTWFPLDLMIGNDTITMDSSNLLILLNGQPWQHCLFAQSNTLNKM